MSIQVETERLIAGLGADDRADVLACQRQLWSVVRRAGRPGAESDKSQVLARLNSALARDIPGAARRDLLWMLSEIGGDESIDTIAALLRDSELREDARMALERIPGDKSLAALQAGLTNARDDFKPNIVQSLRRRLVKVPGYPCRKLVPTKETSVNASTYGVPNIRGRGFRVSTVG